MSELIEALLARAIAWCERNVADGWLPVAARRALDAVEIGGGARLFAGEAARPLVVALVGGTGVGKSSLLNRLAGSAVAQTGVQRPTSREVTAYLHESVRLAKLPPELPLERVRVRTHARDEWRGVLWLDAPDMDSVEAANRALTLAWLPHADLLIYVVSPERYRDDVGWRVLKARGDRHGWVFVLNRSDESHPEQLDDLRRMLRDGGFASPLLFATCCAPAPTAAPPLDQFDALRAAIARLDSEHAVNELERLGLRAALQDLRTALESAAGALGDEAAWSALVAQAGDAWRSAQAEILAESSFGLRVAARRWQGGEDRIAALAARVFGRQSPPDERASAAERPASGLWEEWMTRRAVQLVDQVELRARDAGLPADALRARLDPLLEASLAQADSGIAAGARAILARHERGIGRRVESAARHAMKLLPAGALLWVGWGVVLGYYRASSGAGEYLGANFAVNSAVLVAIAWLLPFALLRLVRRDPVQRAEAALRAGLTRVLDATGERMAAELNRLARDAAARRAPAAELIRDAGAPDAARLRSPDDAAKRITAQTVRR